MAGNAAAYFRDSSGAHRTSDRTLARLKTPRLSPEDMARLTSEAGLRFESRISALMDEYRGKFDKWEALLREDFSIVCFGLGSKRRLLQDFHSRRLSGETCVVVNGFFPALTLRHLLAAIADDVLEMSAGAAAPSAPGSGGTDQLDSICGALDEWGAEEGGRRLFLLVHNIDGPMLRNERSQSALARLAAHPRVGLVCSVDHINAPLIWDQRKLTDFNFAWFDSTTFLPYTEETRFGVDGSSSSSLLAPSSLFGGAGGGGVLALNSLLHVFASLNTNAREIYLRLVRHQLDSSSSDEHTTADDGDAGDGDAGEGLSFGELYRRCREAFLVNSDLTLRAQLTEFRDHRLVATRKAADGVEYLSIPLPRATLLDFLEAQEANKDEGQF